MTKLKSRKRAPAISLTVGDWVRFDAVAFKHLDFPSDGARRIRERVLADAAEGQVVGVSWLAEGVYFPYQPPQYLGDLGDSEPEPAYFATSARVPIVYVRLGVSGKAYPILATTVQPVQVEPTRRLPWRKGLPPYLTEHGGWMSVVIRDRPGADLPTPAKTA